MFQEEIAKIWDGEKKQIVSKKLIQENIIKIWNKINKDDVRNSFAKSIGLLETFE